MTDEQPTTSDYRARPLPEVGTVELLKTIQPEQRVVVEAKNIFKSLTMQVNGLIFIVATIVSVLDVLFGANVIEPIVKIFTSDPQRVTVIITTITQIYTALNVVLRLRTTQPVTLRTDVKE